MTRRRRTPQTPRRRGKPPDHESDNWIVTDANDRGAPHLLTRGHRALAEKHRHIALHDPARVLREVKAKRKILAAHEKSDGGYCELCYYGYGGGSWPCPTVRALAAVYGDHPDYDKAWRP